MLLLYVAIVVVGALMAAIPTLIAAILHPGSAVTALLRLMPGSAVERVMAIAGMLVLAKVLTLVAGSASHNVALRAVTGPTGPDGSQPDPPEGVPKSACWYIESVAGDRPPVSCSFVEFDERGDYLNFEQHRHAYERVGKLADEKLPLTLVIFVHGWRHNGQSGNVLDFNQFLSQLAAGYNDAGQPRRVHGIYLAWRGGVLRPTVKRDETFRKVKELYGGEIVDTRLAARWINLNRILESVSYFDRKSVPEHKFGGTSFSRTLFTLAFTAKGKAPATEVFLIGHSFGGLLLERTFQNAAISQLTESWRMGQERHSDNVNPLPFDSVVLVNSAAPSIYAKQFQSYLAAHRQAMIRAGVVGANAPIFFSLTSEKDWATGIVHPIANRLAGLLPTLRRRYKGNEFILEEAPGNRDVVIPQAYYYRHTPGHNPLLVNRFIEQAASPPHGDGPGRSGYVQKNLKTGGGDPLQFTTTGAPGQPDRNWMICFPPQFEHWRRFSIYHGRRPVAWTFRNQQYVYKDTAYWIVRCSKEIIAGHNDIWSQAAMETYAALHQAALVMRKQPLQPLVTKP